MSERRGVLKPRYPILGAIRIGERVDTGKVDKKTGKPISRPKRLETFRLTSPNPTLLAAASKHYGGEVTEWNNAPGGRQWQLYTEVNCLSVTVPPDESYQQAYEQYDQHGECILQCNGETITHAQNKDLIGQTCDHDPEHAEFDLYTRLKVILHNIPSSMGVWQIRTKGYYSGSELIAMAPFLENAASNGAFLECTLRVEMRKKRTEGQNRVFPVIGIQPAGVTFQQLLQGQIPDTALIAPVAGRIRQIQAAEQDLTDDERYAAIMADHPEWAEPEERTIPRQNVTTIPQQQPPRFFGVNPETGEIDEPEIEVEPEPEPEPDNSAEEWWGHELLKQKAKLHDYGITSLGKIKGLMAQCGADPKLGYMDIRDHALLDRMLVTALEESGQGEAPEASSEEGTLL